MKSEENWVGFWSLSLAGDLLWRFWIVGMGNLTLPNNDGRGRNRVQSLVWGKVLLPSISRMRRKIQTQTGRR